MAVSIFDLPETGVPTTDHQLPVMKDGVTTKMTVGQLLSLIVAGAPEALDTLNELAAALADDADFAAHIASQLGQKASLSDLALKADLDDVVRHDVSQSISLAAQAVARRNIGAPLRGHMTGLMLGNNTANAANAIDISAGQAASTETNPGLLILGSLMTKRFDQAWAAGNGNGGWLDGASMPNGTGHIFLIGNPTSGAVDVGASASLSPTLPSGYTQKVRLGSIVRIAGAIQGFRQIGRYFEITSPTTILSDFAQGDTAVLHSLSNVPAGLSLRTALKVTVNRAGSSAYILISSPGQTDGPATTGNANAGVGASGSTAVNMSSSVEIVTDTSTRVRARAQSGTTVQIYLTPVGWHDDAGMQG